MSPKKASVFITGSHGPFHREMKGTGTLQASWKNKDEPHNTDCQQPGAAVTRARRGEGYPGHQGSSAAEPSAGSPFLPASQHLSSEVDYTDLQLRTQKSGATNCPVCQKEGEHVRSVPAQAVWLSHSGVTHSRKKSLRELSRK